MADQPPEQFSDLLSRMGGVLFSEQRLDAILQLIVSLAVETLQSPGGEASVTLRLDGSEHTSNATSERATRADEAQYASDRGPCLTASRTGRFLPISLEPGDSRWPEYAEAALRESFVKSVSAPLVVGGEPTGALNVYSSAPGTFLDRELTTVRLLAEQASVVLANAVAFLKAGRLNDHLVEALATREMIGQATGIIMGREKIGPDEAFDVLRRASQCSNRKLRDIARDVVEHNSRPSAGE